MIKDCYILDLASLVIHDKAERKWPGPEVEPEGRGGAIADENFRSEAKGGEARRDIFPNGSVEVMGIPQVPRRRPAILPPEPADPRGGGVRVHFGKEFGQERRVLGGDGENAETPFFFRNANIIPSDLALAAIAGFLLAQKKARLRLSIAKTTPGGRRPAAMAWATIAVRTELTRISLPPMGRDRPRHPERRISLLDMMGAKSESRSLWVERGRPR
jgi:hypothetical protein